ncbi:MAG: response regulator transcription factor [Acidobacteria bacterium]|nr:response regulator transcription factor [Acidobacteriota bacterium]
MKILIVDDSEPMRRLIKSFIGDLVQEFVECSDGDEALTAYIHHHPDIVLMDLKMEGMDGIEATRQIKAVFPEARIVIVSQYDDASLWQAALGAGAEGYVAKADLFPIRLILGEGK